MSPNSSPRPSPSPAQQVVSRMMRSYHLAIGSRVIQAMLAANLAGQACWVNRNPARPFSFEIRQVKTNRLLGTVTADATAFVDPRKN